MAQTMRSATARLEIRMLVTDFFTMNLAMIIIRDKLPVQGKGWFELKHFIAI